MKADADCAGRQLRSPSRLLLQHQFFAGLREKSSSSTEVNCDSRANPAWTTERDSRIAPGFNLSILNSQFLMQFGNLPNDFKIDAGLLSAGPGFEPLCGFMSNNENINVI